MFAKHVSYNFLVVRLFPETFSNGPLPFEHFIHRNDSIVDLVGRDGIRNDRVALLFDLLH